MIPNQIITPYFFTIRFNITPLYLPSRLWCIYWQTVDTILISNCVEFQMPAHNDSSVAMIDLKESLLFCIYIIGNYLLSELSPSWEAANCAATQELPSILRNPKVHQRVHKSPHMYVYIIGITRKTNIPLQLITSKLNSNDAASTVNVINISLLSELRIGKFVYFKLPAVGYCWGKWGKTKTNLS
jgi:hypothetical protein